MLTLVRRVSLVVGLVFVVFASAAQAQPLGAEMHNMMMPIAGGMGGASIAQPQELLSAVNGNPAAMTRFPGTQFQFGGGWAEATYNLNQTGSVLPGVTPFSAKSGTPGTAIANIGLSRQTSILGLDAVVGFAMISNAGLGVDFRSVPQSNGTSSSLLVMEMTPSMGVRLTDRLALGVNTSLGSSYFDGPFVGNGAMVQAYGLRGAVGLSYDLGDATTLGWYYQSRQRFNYENAISLDLGGGAFQASRNVKMDLPTNIGFGIANHSLMNGKLLLAADFVFKQWEDARLFSSVYRNQWAFQFGTQYSHNRLRLRAGYVYAMNPIKPINTIEVSGIVLPGLQNAVEYVQSQFALINQNRISGGISIVDVTPGFDIDLFAGGMLPESASTGQFTSVKVQSYWIGLGMTYRFGRMPSR
jgi:long-chain fatty acid transport protein